MIDSYQGGDGHGLGSRPMFWYAWPGVSPYAFTPADVGVLHFWDIVKKITL